MVTMDSDLEYKRIARPTQRIFTGRVVRLMDGYTRELKVGQPVLVAVVTAASVMGLLLLAIRSLLSSAAGGGGRRSWKELRKGPEFLVTPLRLRDRDNRLFEVELHGHLAQSALHPADWVQITLKPQDPDLPPRVEQIVNLTTGQLLRPRHATLWSHLGPPLLLQAILGALIVLAVVVLLVLV
ncbi:hypothetical protein AWW66_10665 [Micromonospora rosaria]|uniref:Uncharacterized protein n=1 Tax=Micromonospora rosaria TaxID=47874 RepID=A0A136PU80_9ACTN|nr:hypothetical protein [Micromonospora rosaria]KXK61998.1 hypothetical protein AWW66_10665 [Micromonospora rosaria]